jgi:hypothetical protein
MIRRTSLALGIAFTFTAVSAFAQEGEAAGGRRRRTPAGSENCGSDAAAGGDAKAGAAVDTSAPPDAGGDQVGLRLSYLPMGDAAGQQAERRRQRRYPDQLDLGYMVTPNIMVSLYVVRLRDARLGRQGRLRRRQRRLLRSQLRWSPGPVPPVARSGSGRFGLGVGLK